MSKLILIRLCDCAPFLNELVPTIGPIWQRNLPLFEVLRDGIRLANGQPLGGAPTYIQFGAQLDSCLALPSHSERSTKRH